MLETAKPKINPKKSLESQGGRRILAQRVFGHSSLL